ncbi:MAG TPA: hypothetical protein GXZ90_02170 [Clostridiales bacterium]|nr:hypothetical protein [Clostridiales bacterium]
MKTINLELSNSGIPCLWEEGGGASNTGRAIIIAGAKGQALNPIYIKRKGHLSNGQHALISVEAGCYIIEAWHQRGDFEINIYQVKDVKGEKATVEEVATFNMNEWNKPVPAFLGDAIKASKEKATQYHCKEPYFINKDKQYEQFKDFCR